MKNMPAEGLGPLMENYDSSVVSQSTSEAHEAAKDFFAKIGVRTSEIALKK
jgi:hypothetical protein